MTQATQARIAATTAVGPVHLTVSDLERSLQYYDTIGLQGLSRVEEHSVLGVESSELVSLKELPGARPARSATGLYHLAIRLPDRTALARWLAHAIDQRIAIDGASDHFVSEAIYLHDPDGHGIEIYADRPRSLWDGRLERMGALQPLNIDDLLGVLHGFQESVYAGMPAGTEMGHIHLQVRDIAETIAFYRDVLGFDLTMQMGGTAAFFSAGGYHHHIGTNTWHSRGAGPPPKGSAALQHATILLPDESERDRLVERIRTFSHEIEADATGVFVDDPSHIKLRLDVTPH